MSHLSLSDDLRALLTASPDGITVGEILDRVREKGFGLLLVVLSLPSALPVPAAGYSIPFGILLALLGLQMLVGKKVPVLPAKLRKIRIGRGMAEKMVGVTAWIFGKLEWFIRPRLEWIGGRAGGVLMGVLVILMAVLMMIPIPLTNSFPALVIFLIGIGLSERDGLFAVLACFVGIFATLLYGGLVYALIVHGPEVADTIKDWIKAQLGLSNPEPQ